MPDLPKIPQLDVPIDDEFYAAIGALHNAATFFHCFMCECGIKDLNLTGSILDTMEATPELAELHEQVVSAWSAWLGRD